MRLRKIDLKIITAHVGRFDPTVCSPRVSQTVTATETMGNFTLSLPSVTKGGESAWIQADVLTGDLATDDAVRAAVETIAGEVYRIVSSNTGFCFVTVHFCRRDGG